ncbi:ATP-binding cassette domain-containing protein [Olsenella massiliensis]|uniref:ATP-binding cassette domain-containing protein n=1 Tax=Olsenella massiliensis TaxID=1622075 RepID=UPI00071E0A5E|nr:ATP-binding cassette domain-containing protein [Olsenella massiliensis]
MTLLTKGLGKTIKGRTIFQDISITAPSAEVTGLAGVNGSGKTMLMRAMAGLIRPTTGTVEIDGQTLWADVAFPPSVGLLIENPAFLSGRTGLDNLRVLASIKDVVDDKRVRQVLDLVGLDPDDRRHFSKYSLGMKQRLGIAAAIMELPRLLLLDEPTNALDAAGVKMLTDVVNKMRERGCTIILACHDAHVLRGLSDQVYYLAEGHLDGHEMLGGRGSHAKA